MKSGNDNLVVRQHDRHECRLPALLRVGAEHSTRVVLARTAGDGNRGVRALAVDLSSGGLALESPVYFPKGCRLDVRLLDQEAGPEAPPLLEAAIRIQRTAMLDRSPRFYLGGAFAGSEGPEFFTKLEQVFELVRRSVVVGKVGGPC